MQDESLDATVRAQYDVFSIDQRGLGRSKPSFMTPQCTTENVFNPDNPTDEESVRTFLKQKQNATKNCWDSEEFQLHATDGTDHTYHFLEYSGTSALVNDIDRVRVATGHDKFSLYGISYGTNVMGAYATVYPSSVDKLILDSNDMSKTDMLQSALESAAGRQQAYDRLAFLCEDSGKCPVENVEATLLAIKAELDSDAAGEACGYKPWNLMDVLGLVSARPDASAKGTYVEAMAKARDMQQAIGSAEFWELLGCGKDASQVVNEQEEQGGQEDSQEEEAEPLDPATYDQPTSEDNVAGIPEYAAVAGETGVAGALVMAQDYTNFAYSEGYFISRWRKMRELYPNMGLSDAAETFVEYWSMGYKWPANSPVPPLANPTQGGLVLGQVYDPATPYKWTVDMKQAFPMAALITSNDIRHGAGSSDKNIVGGKEVEGACNAHITEYLLSGTQPTDGTTCGTPSNLDAQFQALDEEH